MSRIKSRALELIRTIKSGEPILNLDRSVPAENLWPAAVEQEADKASSILRSFFLDGFIAPYRTLGRCPDHVFRDCCSVAAFHVLRAGLHSPSASGSGVIVSRLGTGSWSGASAIVVDYDLPHGVDVADIVVLINNEDSLGVISREGGMLGKGIAIEPGPIPQSDALTAQAGTSPRRTDVNLFYAKSKGHLLQIDLKHAVVREAKGENERFYGVPGIAAEEVLSGRVKPPSGTSDHLYSTLRALGQRTPDLGGLPKPGRCPGDCRLKVPKDTAS